jgi:aspartyl/asparaginyl beta-hydroxylase (cupin superfamily)
LRVGNESREFVTGKAWVFDDTMEHEAWNLSDDVRVVLLFEIWRPELSHQERSLVRSMFTAIDQYQGPSSAWSEQ